MTENTLAQRLTAEMLGTGMLVFTGVGSVPATLIVGGNAPFTMAQLGMIVLTFAMAVVAAVYMIGHISGCHINPAVTLALAATGKMPRREVPGYITAQVVGAVMGTFGIIGVLGQKAVDVGLGIAAFQPGAGASQVFIAEAIGTFLLVLVVFGAIDRRAPGGFAGVAIGLAVFAIGMAIAPASGASINPARTLGPMLVGEGAGAVVHWSQLPVYLVAELVGGVLAGLVYILVLNGRWRAVPARAEAPRAAEEALS